jgi:hypothetical protein
LKSPEEIIRDLETDLRDRKAKLAMMIDARVSRFREDFKQRLDDFLRSEERW